jgi:hypothetical protein
MITLNNRALLPMMVSFVLLIGGKALLAIRAVRKYTTTPNANPPSMAMINLTQSSLLNLAFLLTTKMAIQ